MDYTDNIPSTPAAPGAVPPLSFLLSDVAPSIKTGRPTLVTIIVGLLTFFFMACGGVWSEHADVERHNFLSSMTDSEKSICRSEIVISLEKGSSEYGAQDKCIQTVKYLRQARAIVGGL